MIKVFYKLSELFKKIFFLKPKLLALEEIISVWNLLSVCGRQPRIKSLFPVNYDLIYDVVFLKSESLVCTVLIWENLVYLQYT